jgi:hypothetical protein
MLNILPLTASKAVDCDPPSPSELPPLSASQAFNFFWNKLKQHCHCWWFIANNEQSLINVKQVFHWQPLKLLQMMNSRMFFMVLHHKGWKARHCVPVAKAFNSFRKYMQGWFCLAVHTCMYIMDGSSYCWWASHNQYLLFGVVDVSLPGLGSFWKKKKQTNKKQIMYVLTSCCLVVHRKWRIVKCS